MKNPSRIAMTSYACVVLLLFASLNVLQANNNTNSDNERKAYHNITERAQTTKNEKRRIIQEFETQLEKRITLNRKFKYFRRI